MGKETCGIVPPLQAGVFDLAASHLQATKVNETPHNPFRAHRPAPLIEWAHRNRKLNNTPMLAFHIVDGFILINSSAFVH